MEQRLIDTLVRFGAPVLFLAQVFGIFGLPIPDELLLTVAGMLVRRGTLGGTPVLGAAVSGCLIGITFSYVVGRTVGLAAVERFARIHAPALENGRRWFARFGCWLLTFGYFIPGVRHVTAIAAGSTPVGFSTFAAYAYPGGVLWSCGFVALGYYAGDRWREVLATARAHSRWVAVGLVAAGLIYAWTRTRRARQGE